MGKREFLIKVLIFSPVLLVMVIVNYLLDPYRVRGSGAEQNEYIAETMLSGKNIGNYSELGFPNFRILNKCLINRFKAKKQVVVLGSSRDREINFADFPGHTFFNNCMASATLEDDITTFWLYKKRNILPDVLVLGVDPWLLNKNTGAIYYKILKTEYAEAASCIIKDSRKRDAWKPDYYFLNYLNMIISPAYFQYSIAKLRGNRSNIFLTDEYDIDDWLRRSDGSQNYPKSYKTRSAAEVAVIAEDMSVFGLLLKDFHVLDKQRFELFMEAIHGDKVKVVLFLMPFHPITYDLLLKSKKFRIIKDAENYFREYAEKNGIELYGSYDPKVDGITEDEFYDAEHAKWDLVKMHYKIKSLEQK